MGTEDLKTMALKTAGVDKKSAPASTNAFAGQAHWPTEKAVQSALGPSYALWKQLVAKLKKELTLDGEEWNSSGLKHGWSLRLQLKKRNIVYLGPRSGSFVATFVFGDKALAIARKSELPTDVLEAMASAKRYAEGTPVRIEVSKPADVQTVKVLARIKLAH